MEDVYFSFNYEGQLCQIQQIHRLAVIFFQSLKYSFHAILDFSFSGVILLGLPFYVTLCFSLTDFNILSLFCILNVLIKM
jgi:hypothetical protein